MADQLATFAGGCFWCIEAAFAEFKGVKKTVSGLTGGNTPNPTYDQVHQSDTGHVEAVQIIYDPDQVSYQELLDQFWIQIDPTDDGGQFADRGPEYRTAIFYHTPEQQKLAEESKLKLEKSTKFNKPIATQIKPASEFFPAEAYHQGYYKAYPERYQLYKKSSGREDFIHQTWNK